MFCYHHSETECTYRDRHDGESFDEDDFPRYSFTADEGEPWTYVNCTGDVCRDNPACAMPHTDALWVAVDGACRSCGYPDARSSVGVYFHEDNHAWNRAFALSDPSWIHTPQRAELAAGLNALLLAIGIRREQALDRRRIQYSGGPRLLKRIVVQTDSKNLADAMNDFIYDWNWQHGIFYNRHGFQIADSDLFTQLRNAADELEALDVEVQFWHVYREDNEEADYLAAAALDGLDAVQAMRVWAEERAALESEDESMDDEDEDDSGCVMDDEWDDIFDDDEEYYGHAPDQINFQYMEVWADGRLLYRQ